MDQLIDKILFSGIDNAGKSSIIYTIKNQYHFMSGLKPTTGIKRKNYKVLDIEFILWDLGGQEAYRDSYFEREELVFSDVALFMYVLDIQDEERFDLALSYYNKILNSMKKLKTNPIIIILFHKTDPDLKYDEKTKIFLDDLRKRFEKISKGFDVTFFETSVFLKWSLINAFSYGLRKLSDKSAADLMKYLKEWAKILGTKSLILINDQDIVVGEYFKDKSSYLEINEKMENIVSIAKDSIKTNKPTIIRSANTLISTDPIKIGDHNLLLVKYTDDPKKFEDIVSYTIDFEKYPDLETILNGYFKNY
ncbi:MAG: hypothetical protein EU551_04250 [Promethearchaeota archaeon]|nr:MAG: hypothetical protein EU551_04250 [Candidatus Lokiarchaeota archaeon]